MARTPAPWHVEDSGGAVSVMFFDEGEATAVAYMADTAEADDNAALVAAAPDLLAALVAYDAAFQALAHNLTGVHVNLLDGVRMSAAREAARAAIAKAEDR